MLQYLLQYCLRISSFLLLAAWVERGSVGVNNRKSL